jgi:hypothetical protein
MSRSGVTAIVYPNAINADGCISSDLREICIGLMALGWRLRSNITLKRAGTFEEIGNVRISDVIDAADGDQVRNADWWHKRETLKQEN